MKKAKGKDKVFCLQLKGRQRFMRLFGESSKPRGLACGFVTLKSKESVGLHNTENKEEALIILQGLAQLSYGKRSRIKVSKNCFIYIPPKTSHNIKNIGARLLKYIYTTSPV
jgi:mannose-6-phosphate isomerase-like protein (cupin superfamily)